MLSVDQEYEYFISQENLELAWRRLNSSSILDTKDRLGLKIFSAKTEEHLKILRNTLLKNYTPSRPFFIHGPKKNGSVRVRTFLEVRDRIVYQAIGHVIIENCLEDIWASANKTIFAHIPTKKWRNGNTNDFTFLPTRPVGNNKGQYKRFLDTVQYDIKKAAEKTDIWLVETDIASFYPSLDHRLIIEMLSRRSWLKNEKLLDLLRRCLERWSALTPGISSGQGVPIGYETSELLATLFLLDIDLELDLSSQNISMRRFVDDMYVFVEGRENAKRFLVEYDLALQYRALVRNTNKSKYNLCNTEMADRSILDREMRSKLSFVENVQEDIQVQQDIAAISEQDVLCLGVCDESDIDCIREHLSTISFILYRQKTYSEKLRRIALCILEEFPDKTLHATKYLSQYKGDHQIRDSLLAIAERPSWYSPCRVDCIMATIEVGGFDPHIQDTLVGRAIQNEDWYLTDAAIDILADHDYPLIQLSNNVMQGYDCYLTQAKILFRCFSQSRDIDRKIEIINVALASSCYTLNTLGIYLSRRVANNISRGKLQSAHLPDELKHLLFPTQHQDIKAFIQAFEDFFEFEMDTPFVRYIPDIGTSSQLLVDMQDALEGDRLGFIKALHDFTLQFLVAYVRVRDNDISFQANSLREVLAKIHQEGEEYIAISKLRDLKEFADDEDYSKVTVSDKKDIHNKIDRIIAIDLYEYYRRNSQSFPPKIQAKINKYDTNTNGGNENMRDKLFISYSRKNTAWLTKLKTHLKPLSIYQKLYVWDDTQIKPGQNWSIEIKKALASAKVAVLLVTPDFLASDFITSQEIPEFLKAAKKDGLTIIWIAVSSSNYKSTPLSAYQCVNQPNRPLDMMTEGEQNEEFVKISEKIDDAMRSS